MLHGVPDGIETCDGALLPIEIKSHKRVQRIDALELASYWLLLEPYRTRQVPPSRYLILRDSSAPQEIAIEIVGRPDGESGQLAIWGYLSSFTCGNSKRGSQWLSNVRKQRTQKPKDLRRLLDSFCCGGLVCQLPEHALQGDA
jgi:hypothetical protein